MRKDTEAICLNNQTVGNLKKYLDRFPDNAQITIWHDYREYDCQIACNTEHQEEQNKVQLMVGRFLNLS